MFAAITNYYYEIKLLFAFKLILLYSIHWLYVKLPKNTSIHLIFLCTYIKMTMIIMSRIDKLILKISQKKMQNI